MNPAQTVARLYKRLETFTMTRMAPASRLETDSLLYWRVRILFTLIFSGLGLSIAALIPGLILLIQEGLWALMVLDLLFWLIGIGLLTSRRLGYAIRAAITLSLFYAVGMAILVFVGMLSGGPAWLFAFAVLAGVLLGSTAAVAAVFVNAVTLGLIGGFTGGGWIGAGLPFFPTAEAGITAGANFIVLNAISAISVSVLVKGLVAAQEKEKGLIRTLEREHSRLREAKQRLEHEVERHERTGRALRESEERYRALFERSLDCVYVHDFSGEFKDANRAALDLLGYERKDIAQLNFLSVLAEDQHHLARRLIEELRETGHQREVMELRLRRKDGRTVHVESKGSVIYRDGKPLGVLGIARDISARKEAEKERAELQAQLRRSHKMEAIGTLAGGIAHEFNNILGIVLGNAELAMDDIPDANPAARNLQEVREACIRGREVVRQLLGYSRKEEGSLEPVRLDSVIKGALALLRSSVPSHIQIGTRMDEEVPTVRADSTRMTQVLIHLCTNAAHAMEVEGGTLEIGLTGVQLPQDAWGEYPRMAPGRYVKLTVRDTGVGMSPEIVERIFDPYFTLKAVGKGTGMGLSVVHGIVRSHGGAVFVHSKPGAGSTFEILLPAFEEGTEAARGTEEQKEFPDGTGRILFVDDESSLGNMAEVMLQRLGYEAVVETNPLNALALFRDDPDGFELVITDAAMPEMTGDRLALEVMGIRPDIPVVLCTGFSERIPEEKATEMGIAAYVTKPFVMKDLAATIQRVLAQNSPSFGARSAQHRT